MLKQVLVFKTSVTTQQKIAQVSPLLDTLMDKSEKWNFDLEDCDNILRVEAINLKPWQIISSLTAVGFACEELED